MGLGKARILAFLPTFDLRGGLMKGDKDIIQQLNAVLTGELTAINQYFLHARMCDNWGFKKLGSKIWEESIDEMKHAQTLTDRLLFLEGLPNLQKLGKLRIGENVEEVLKADLELEHENIPMVRKGIETCLAKQDTATREILEHILVEEEMHVDWLETQLSVIKEIGIQNYLATML
jgi:bacterioferritin